jgi:KDO2-lipid IV(A) lauroyltransferase
MNGSFKNLWQKFVVHALEFITAVSRFVPLRMMLAFAAQLGILGFKFSKRYRDVALKNLNLAYGDLITDSEKLEITRQVFINFAKAAIEFPAASNLSDAKVRNLVRLSPEDKERIDGLINGGKPFIAVSAHFGNFELMARRLSLDGYKFVVVVRNDNNTAIADAINKVREGSGYEIIGRGDAAGVLLRRMRRETSLCVVMLPDQKSDEIFVPFFGQVTGTVAGPAVIALRTGAPILPIFSLRNPDDTHTLVLGDLIETDAPKGDRRSAESIMCEINDAIEFMVRRYPEQWLWLHDRWRVKPPKDHELKSLKSKVVPN